MNNDLEQFSEEHLKEILDEDINPLSGFSSVPNYWLHYFARIALAAEQAKPAALVVIDKHTDEVMLDISDEGRHLQAGDALYTTPQPAHTEQEITDNVRDALEKALNAMQFMGDTLNNLDAVCAEDVEHVTPAFEAIRKLLAAAPKPESEL